MQVGPRADMRNLLNVPVEAMARQGLVARPREAQDDVTVVVARVLGSGSGSWSGAP